jgi:hypothetical protein
MIIDDHPTDKTPNVPATPEPAEPAGQPGAGASQGRQAGAAAMITFEFFAYSEPEWDRIKVAVRDALGRDADHIERRVITRTVGNSGITRLFRDHIQTAGSLYLFQNANTRQRPRRAELIALRKDAENLQTSIIAALAVQVGTQYDDTSRLLLRHGVDGDMVTASSGYFTKLLHNLDRQIEQAGQRGDNARKTARDHYWSELLAIWCDLGGKPHGVEAAEFLWVASRPVMGGAVPAHKSIVQWLERRRATR